MGKRKKPAPRCGTVILIDEYIRNSDLLDIVEFIGMHLPPRATLNVYACPLDKLPEPFCSGVRHGY